jgi:hypothetical protein
MRPSAWRLFLRSSGEAAITYGTLPYCQSKLPDNCQRGVKALRIVSLYLLLVLGIVYRNIQATYSYWSVVGIPHWQGENNAWKRVSVESWIQTSSIHYFPCTFFDYKYLIYFLLLMKISGYPEVGGSTFLRNVGKHPQSCTISQPRRPKYDLNLIRVICSVLILWNRQSQRNNLNFITSVFLIL